MTTVKIDVVGDDVVKTKLKKVALAVDDISKTDIKRELIAAKDEARIYPSEIPGQKYIRTGTYNRSFRFTGSGGTYTIKSDAVLKGRHYTQYVGGLPDGTGQAKIHAGRWTLIKDAIDRALERIKAEAEERFNKILTGSL